MDIVKLKDIGFQKAGCWVSNDGSIDFMLERFDIRVVAQ